MQHIHKAHAPMTHTNKALPKLDRDDLARKTTFVSQMQYEVARNRMVELSASESKLCTEVHSGLDKVSREFFSRLVNCGAPKLDSTEGPIAKTAEFLHSELDKSESWQRLERACYGSSAAAAISTSVVIDELLASTTIPKFHDTVEEEDRKEELEFWLESCEESEDASGMLRTILSAASRKASQEVKAFEVACLSVGTDPMDFDSSDPDGAMETARALRHDKQFADLVQRLGRMRRSVRSARRKVGTGTVVPVGIECGDDIARLLPGELAELSNPATEMLALSKLLNRESLQYRLRPNESSEAGPFVVVLDCSGSMSSMIRDAAAFSVAAMMSASEENRQCTLIAHNTKAEIVCGIDPNAKPSEILAALRTAAGMKTGGGTDFRPALKMAATIVARHDNKADVLMITDGCGPVGDRSVLDGCELHLVELCGATNPALEEMATTITKSDGSLKSAIEKTATAAAIATRRRHS